VVKTSNVARVILGLAFLFFGLNGFLHFFNPPAPSGDAAIVYTGLVATGYLFPTMFGVMVLSGVMLVVGRFVPLALAFLAPVLVNIVGFHLFLDPGGIGLGAVLTVLEVFLAWSYRDAFKTMLAARHTLAPQTTPVLRPEVPAIQKSATSGGTWS
jgi:hypothetical protein